MRRSVLFMRFFSVVILVIVVTALFTTLLYNYIARTVFTQIKENELLPKARAMGRILGQFSGRSEINEFLDTLTLDSTPDSLLGAYLMVVNARGEEVFVSDEYTDQYHESMLGAARDVLSKGEMRTNEIAALKHTSMVGVGVPILSDEGTVLGAVLMMVPLYEAMVAMGSLNGALAMSLVMSLPLVALLVYYAAKLVIDPLRQMRDVALKMAGGDFTARADTNQRGEVGQLARSLNYLSQELSRSISTLLLERNRLRQTVDGLSEGIVSTDRFARLTYFNPAIRRLFAAVPIPADADARLRAVPDGGVWDDFMRVVDTGETVSHPLKLPDRTLLVTIGALRDDEGAIAGAVGLFSDITQSERLERTRRDYVANVSHEMRSPLTAMRALIEPLSEGMVTDEDTRRRYYSILLRETMRLSRLINDLLELSRLQSGTLALERRMVRLDAVFEGLRERYEPIAEERCLSFAVDPALEDCPAVYTNEDRVEQILVILIDNAMKYTPEGGSVRVSGAWDEEKVTLSVTDTGVGIDPADQPYVFDRFYKVDKAHTSLGSGLGLSIASELLKQLGEQISLTSQVGKGSRFSFTITRRADEGELARHDE